MVSEQAIFSTALKIKILKPIICYLNFILLILNPQYTRCHVLSDYFMYNMWSKNGIKHKHQSASERKG